MAIRNFAPAPASRPVSDAPQDAVLRLVCGAQSALNMLAGILTERGTVN